MMASSCRASVVVEKSSKTLTPANPPAVIVHHPRRINQFMSDALVIPLAVIVFDELADRSAKMTGTERDHPTEALMLDRAYKSLRVGIGMWCPKRCLDDTNAC